MSGTYLSRMRKEAKLTQEEVSKITGLSQSMICRIEANPKSASLEHLVKILEALGMDLKQLLYSNLADPGEFQTSPETLGMLRPKDPYQKLQQNLARLREFLDEEAGSFKSEAARQYLDRLNSLLQALDRKPNLYLAGRSDAGKSRFANSILGQKILPSYYTPATRLLTIVRHIEDRPLWLKEDVVILSSEFKPEQWNDGSHIESCRLLVGGYETLQHYGTHRDSQRLAEAFAAMVFVEADVLKVCNIIDTPGLLNSDEDNSKSEAGMHLLDILVYFSPVSGFLDANDVTVINECVKRLPVLETVVPNAHKLSNLFIVLSHAAPHISTEEIQNIMETKSRVLHHHLSDTLNERWQCLNLKSEDLNILSRMFAFWYETKQRHKPLSLALESSLSSPVVQYQLASSDTLMENFRRELDADFSRYLNLFNDVKANSSRFHEQHLQALAELPEKRKEIKNRRSDVIETIEELKDESLDLLDEILSKNLNEDRIVAFLKQKFKDKKDEAKEYALTLFLETLNKRISNAINTSSRKLNKKIDSFLSSYEQAALLFPGIGPVETDIPFDAKGSFAAGLVGAAGTLGALGAWAAALGNLGGYIAIAKIMGWLSAVGVGFGWSGGAAGLMSIIATLGGPLTLGVAAAGAVGLTAWALIGESWETRLARRIVKILEEKELRKKYRASVRKYWKDSRVAFDVAALQVEKSFSDHISYIERLSCQTHDELPGLELILTELTRVRQATLFHWKSLSASDKK